MKERPILFSGAMVRAILDGRKTQTRRIVKPQPTPGQGMVNASYCGHPHLWLRSGPCRSDDPTYEWKCPYGKPGDRFWVREAWRVGKPHDQTPPCDILPAALAIDKGVTVLYEAGGWRSVGPSGRGEPTYPDDAGMPDWAGKCRPSMFMPRAMSRITLEITGVRVERLNDCSVKDAIAEGAEPLPPDPAITQVCPEDYVAGYRKLWDSINGAGAWKANPWVWVVEFRRV